MVGWYFSNVENYLKRKCDLKQTKHIARHVIEYFPRYTGQINPLNAPY